MTNVVRVVIYRDSSDEWRWRAEAGNGEIVATGEAHTRPQDAERAARGVLGDEILLVRDNGVHTTEEADDGPA